MTKYIRFLLLLTAVTLIHGCVQQKIVDKIDIVQMSAYDLGENGLIKGTLGVNHFSRNQEAQQKPYTASGKTISHVWNKIDSRTMYPVRMGRLEVTLIGDAYAERGLRELIDVSSRDTMIGTSMYFAVVDGRAQAMLEGDYKGSQLPSKHISNMLQYNQTLGNMPTTNLHQFAYSMRGHGQDPFLPLLIQHNKHIAIAGLALFDDDQYVAKIDNDEMFVFRRLYENQPAGNIEIPFKAKGKRQYVNIGHVHTRRSYSFHRMATNPAVTIKVNMKGAISEITTSLKLGKKSTINMIEKQMEKRFVSEAEKLIGRFQEQNIDPLGIGRHARNAYRNWQSKKWTDIYPQLDVDVQADIHIVEYGGNR